MKKEACNAPNETVQDAGAVYVLGGGEGVRRTNILHITRRRREREEKSVAKLLRTYINLHTYNQSFRSAGLA